MARGWGEMCGYKDAVDSCMDSVSGLLPYSAHGRELCEFLLLGGDGIEERFGVLRRDVNVDVRCV